MSPIGAQINFVVPVRDIERLRELAGSGTEFAQIFNAPSPSHEAYAAKRFECTDQDKTINRTFHQNVQHPVRAITKVDIGRAGLISFDKCSCARPHKRMTSLVITSQISFRFDDNAGATAPVQSRTNQLTRTNHRFPFEEVSTN